VNVQEKIPGRALVDSAKEKKARMERKRIFEPGDMVISFTGQAGMVLDPATLARVRGLYKAGRRPGYYFAPGCCNSPDYVTQVPVLFEDGTYDVMRSMNVKKTTDLPVEKTEKIRQMVDEARPGRSEEVYMEDCIFCKIVRGEIPCFKVYENDKVLAFEDINPISAGHTLIIPKRHSENLWEIPEEDLTAIHAASKKVGDAVRKALNAVGVAVLQLNGRGVSQVVMHYHLHLMPRQEGEPHLPVTMWDLKKGDMGAIKGIAEKISSALD
jgi:histidine triad (HIT) family protein